jgi:hypothetical protein
MEVVVEGSLFTRSTTTLSPAHTLMGLPGNSLHAYECQFRNMALFLAKYPKYLLKM